MAATVDLGGLLTDPFTLRTVFSVVAGALTGLVVVRLTFLLHNQRDLFRALRAVRAELLYDSDALERLARLLRDDMRTQHVDLPIEVPAGATIEVSYVLSLPGALSTAAFDQLRQSGRLFDLPEPTRLALFDLYETVERINRLRGHREALQYNSVGNVHLLIDAAELGLEPGETVTEADLSADVLDRLEELRRLRRATRGINRSILRLAANISPPERVEALGLEQYADSAGDREPLTIDEAVELLEAVEAESFWARVV